MAGREGLRGKKLHLPDPTADHGSHEEVDDSGDSGLFSCIIFVEVKKITQTRHSTLKLLNFYLFGEIWTKDD